MPKFNYVALDARGQESVGVLEATTSNEVIAHLRQSGYFPTSVVEEGKAAVARAAKKKSPKAVAARASAAPAGKGIVLFQKKTIKPKTLMIFTRQLATLIDAGLPLLRGLTVLAKQERDLVLKGTINALADGVQGGSTFSESLAQHPRIFNKLYINMVKAAMFYPVVVIVIAVLILSFLLVFIVPKFQQIFHDMLGNRPLPGITQFVIDASNILKEQWYYVIGGIVIFTVGYKIFASSPAGKIIIDRVKLYMPLFGDLTRKSSISRFARTLGTLVTSGVPILQALNITRETAGNSVIADAITKVHDSVKEGESIVHPLEASGVFPPMVISMIDVGEETGQLPEMLLKIAEVYDDEVDNAVTGLTSLLEPIMIVILAVIVGTIVIALFMPLISIIQGMQSQTGG